MYSKNKVRNRVILKCFWSCLYITCCIIFYGCTTPSIVATQSIQKGDAFNNENRYEEAIKYYEEYLKVSPSLGVYRNLSMEAQVYRKLAHAYSTQGEYERSKDYLEKAIKADSTQGSSNNVQNAENYRLLGLTYAYSGDTKEALEWLERSLSINEGLETSIKNEKKSSVASTYLSLSQLHLSLGNYDESEHYAYKAQSLYATLPDSYSGMAEAGLTLGIIARDKGDLSKAEKIIISSQELMKEHDLNVGRHLQALSEIAIRTGNIEQGIRLKADALEEAKKSNIKPQIIIAFMRLGDAYHQLGDEKKANEYYKEALEVEKEIQQTGSAGFTPSLNPKGNLQQTYDYYTKAGSNIGTGLVLLRIGELQLQQNNPDSAVRLFSDAREYLMKSGSKEGIAKANLKIAEVRISQGDYKEARTYLTEAKKHTDQPDMKWQILYQEGLIFEEEQLIDSARNAYINSINVIDEMRANFSVAEFKTLFANTKVQVYDRMIMLLLKNRDGWKDLTATEALHLAFELSEQSRSRTFLDLMGNKKIDARRPQDSTILAEEQLVRLKISQLVKELHTTENSTAILQLSKELNDTQKKHEDLLKAIKLLNTSYSTLINIDPPSLDDIQEKIDDKSVLLEYWLSEEALVIFVVKNSSVHAEIVPVKKAEIQRQLKGTRNAIALKEAAMAEKILKTLYGYLIYPVKEKLVNHSNIILVPHSSLHFLPFQALQSANNKFLIEQFILSSAPSASVFYYTMLKEVPKGNKFLGMALGDLRIGANTALPGTQLEVDQLNRLYNAEGKEKNPAFRETYFKKEAADFRYIHIATHGIFNPRQPLYSYLLMQPSDNSDGRLTVDEIFGMNINSKLVTLSACETGLGELGDADDLVGLSRAFLYAGSSGVVVSLWKVDDATTAWLMTRFHQYIGVGQSHSEALTFAQRDLIHRKLTVHNDNNSMKSVHIDPRINEALAGKELGSERNPYYWAPFIIIGNGSVN